MSSNSSEEHEAMRQNKLERINCNNLSLIKAAKEVPVQEENLGSFKFQNIYVLLPDNAQHTFPQKTQHPKRLLELVPL